VKRQGSYDKQLKAEEARVRLRSAFEQKLRAVNTPNDALAFVGQVPKVGAMDRVWYSNFAFFWGNAFAIPGGADRGELSLYLGVVRRIGANGGLKAEALSEIEERINSAMGGRP